jgi:hypothetical protein
LKNTKVSIGDFAVRGLPSTTFAWVQNVIDELSTYTDQSRQRSLSLRLRYSSTIRLTNFVSWMRALPVQQALVQLEQLVR